MTSNQHPGSDFDYYADRTKYNGRYEALIRWRKTP